MTAIELKNDLYEMIDGLHDEDVLECVHKVVRTFQMKNSAQAGIGPIDELNEVQQARLQKSIQQAKNGQVISDEVFKQRLAEKVINEDATLTHFASEKVLAKDWLSPKEDEVWQDL